MAAKHRRKSRRSKKIAVIGAATATATALTVGVAPPPKTDSAQVAENVDLMAAIRPFPGPDQIPDITGGLGSAAYDFNQALAEVVIKAIVEGINLGPLAAAAGLDPLVLVTNLLTKVPVSLLPQLLDAVPLDIDLLDRLLQQVATIPLAQGTINTVLGLLQLTGNSSLNELLAKLLGIDLSNGLDLSELKVPGVNIITTGAPFALLKMLGVDLGWTPGLPNAVANEINQTEYLKLGAEGVLDLLTTRLEESGLDLGGLLSAGLQNIVGQLPIDLPDILDLRVPVTVGFGIGAFSLATSYQQILDQLNLQPGGTSPNADHPLLGSITLLPIVLLNNPARPDGGAAARAYPLGQLLGINVLNPDTHATHNGGLEIPGTGLSATGANVIPLLIDLTAEYQPLSDFSAWPNAFSLFNNVAAGLLPTYLLRGIDTARLNEQLDEQVNEILGNVGSPLSINIYLTAPANSLPLLEPLYLLGDAVNIATAGLLPNNPFTMLANALAPALTSLTALGYTNAVRQPDGSYTRTLTGASTPTPFFSYPNVNWGQVPFDIVNQLVQGFQKEFFSGNPTPGPPNAITGLLKLLGDLLGGGLGLAPFTAPQQATTLAQATDLPSNDATMMTLSTDPEGDISTGRHAAPADTPVPDDSGMAPKHVAGEVVTEEAEDSTEVDDETGTEVVSDAEDTEDTEGTAGTEGTEEPDETADKVDETETDATETDDEDGPQTNVVRDAANAFAPNKTTPPATAADDDTTTTEDDSVTADAPSGSVDGDQSSDQAA